MSLTKKVKCELSIAYLFTFLIRGGIKEGCTNYCAIHLFGIHILCRDCSYYGVYRCSSYLGVIPHNLKSNTVNKLLRFVYRQVELECFVLQCKFSSFIISTDPRFFWDCKCSLKGEVLGWSAFFIGIMSTSFGSAYYHLKPNDASLVWDRLPVSKIIFFFN